MGRSREEIHAMCRARGIETTKLWASPNDKALSEIERGYAQELLEIYSKEEDQVKHNYKILNQARLAALASIVSAITAGIAVYLGK